MERELKQAYIQEANYQNKMLKNLQKWLRNLIIFSSFSILLIYFGPSIHPLMKTVGIILTVVCVVACIFVGLSLRNGKSNVNKLLDILEKK